MTIKIEDRKIIFSSGKEKCAYGGIIGIGLDNDVIYEGYDGHIHDESILIEDDEDRRNALQSDDLIELADAMIKRWQNFKDYQVKRII
jgi:hypothetical protein